MPAKSVFSHSSKDDGIVRELRQALSDLAIETSADCERALQARTEIGNADYFLVMVSLSALNSDWVQREIAHAKSLNKRIIPQTLPNIGSPILRLLFGEDQRKRRRAPGNSRSPLRACTRRSHSPRPNQCRTGSRPDPPINRLPQLKKSRTGNAQP